MPLIRITHVFDHVFVSPIVSSYICLPNVEPSLQAITNKISLACTPPIIASFLLCRCVDNAEVLEETAVDGARHPRHTAILVIQEAYGISPKKAYPLDHNKVSKLSRFLSVILPVPVDVSACVALLSG